ncbi:MAG: ArsR/SmtB family transcription factor [Acidimicrobiia bacterium]
MDALQVIAEPRRRAILSLIWDKELSAGEIASRFDVTFGAVSQHLGVLRSAGFVKVRREGNHRYYVAEQAALGPLRSLLEGMWDENLDRLVAAVESESPR